MKNCFISSCQVLFSALILCSKHTRNFQEIKDYIATGEPMDKAGAYAIQGKGSFMVRSFSGSKSNIIGLPLDELKTLLKKTRYPYAT